MDNDAAEPLASLKWGPLGRKGSGVLPTYLVLMSLPSPLASHRYINHSCAPNCVAEVVTFDKEDKIIIISSRRIPKGEEVGVGLFGEMAQESKSLSRTVTKEMPVEPSKSCTNGFVLRNFFGTRKNISASLGLNVQSPDCADWRLSLSRAGWKEKGMEPRNGL